jgi:hypothetical protein
VDQHQQPRKPVLTRRLAVLLIGTWVYVGLLSYLVFLGYSAEWTGLGEAKVPKDVQPAKTLWDWLTLLLPAYIAFIGTYYGMRITRQQTEVEEQRARETAVQTYVDQALSLLANEDPRDSQRSGELRVLLRARTRMLLDRIGATDKKSVVRFLHDAGLILGELPAVRLDGADLSRVILNGMDLREANLNGANLREAELHGADLSGAFMYEANLSGVLLNGANLSKAKGISNEELEDQASALEGATMPDGQLYEDWLKSKGGGEDE